LRPSRARSDTAAVGGDPVPLTALRLASCQRRAVPFWNRPTSSASKVAVVNLLLLVGELLQFLEHRSICSGSSW